MRLHILGAAMVVVLLFGAAASANSEYRIETGDLTPFVWQGTSYVPLKSTADYVGARVAWDDRAQRATVDYRGRSLVVIAGDTTAYYAGQPVLLPAPPVVIGHRLLVPVVIFDRYFDVPVRWDARASQVLILGPSGWGYIYVSPGPPSYLIPFLQGVGPPPWAPAHGYRQQFYPVYGHYPATYLPRPFVYGGATYIPLRSLANVIGAALLWDSLRNRAVIIIDGREVVLVVGSPVVIIGGRSITLPAPPVVVGGQLFVPHGFVRDHLRIELDRRDDRLRVKGPQQWHEFRVASTPPGHVFGLAQRERERSAVGLPTGRPQVQPRADRTPSGVGLPTQRPQPERGRGQAQPAPAGQKPPASPPAKGEPKGKGSGQDTGWFEKARGK